MDLVEQLMERLEALKEQRDAVKNERRDLDAKLAQFNQLSWQKLKVAAG